MAFMVVRSCISAREQEIGSGSKPIECVERGRYALREATPYVRQRQEGAVRLLRENCRCHRRGRAHVTAQDQHEGYNHKHPRFALLTMGELRNGRVFCVPLKADWLRTRQTVFPGAHLLERQLLPCILPLREKSRTYRSSCSRRISNASRAAMRPASLILEALPKPSKNSCSNTPTVKTRSLLCPLWSNTR